MIAVMSGKHKQVLRKTRPDLLRNVNVTERLMSVLISDLPNFNHMKDQINVSNSDLLFPVDSCCV